MSKIIKNKSQLNTPKYQQAKEENSQVKSDNTELNENENKRSKLTYAVKAVLKGKFIYSCKCQRNNT